MREDSGKKVNREFGLTSKSVENKTTVFVIIFIILIMGIRSYVSMPKESFPEVVMAEIYIGTPYPGNSPLDIENLVTRPIEKELNSISGVDKITSTSIQDYSTIVVKFQSDVEVEEALRKVKDAVDKAKKDLPTDLDQEPNVFELNFSEFPVMNINLSGDFTMDQLKEYAEYLEDEIEKLPEISKVDIRGSREREVKIDVDVHKMEALQISFNDIAGAISNENKTISGGNYKSGDLERTIRVAGEFKNVDDMKNIIVKHEKGNIVYLQDVATVTFDYEARKSYAREYQKPVVMLDIIKQSGENLLNASDQIKVILDHAKKALFPKNLQISITNDQSFQTRDMVNNLENSIISGVILVVLVLLFFLGLRNALFVGVAIPLSMFMAFMILGAMGVTMNMMVLFSLILALGMLVDNGIVVVENIYRLMDQGYSPMRAAKEGVGEVAWPIIASTATTLAAFLPLAIWPGMMGEFMKYLPITLMIVLGSSLFVALVINPVLTAVYMRVGAQVSDKKKNNKKSFIYIGIGILVGIAGAITLSNLLIVIGVLLMINTYWLNPATNWFQGKLLPALEARYKNLLKYALARPGAFFGATIGLLVFSFILLGIFAPKVEFFPSNEPHYINIFIEKPIGTDIEATNKFTKEVEAIVVNLMKKYEDEEVAEGGKKNWLVESIIAQVGEGTSDPTQGVSMGVTPHKARVTVSFEQFQFRKGVATSKVMQDIRDAVKGFPGVQITVDKDNAGPPVGKPVNIEISGDDFEELIAISSDVRRFINESGVGGIEELKSDLELGKPEMLVEIDRDKARRFGVSTGQVANELRTALFGMEVSKYKLGEDDYPIQIRLKEDQRNDVEILMNQRITFRDQSSGKIKQIPISAIAKNKKTATYGSVKRKNLKRVATISSNVLDGYNANEVVANIKEAMINYKMPEGYDLKFTGQQEEQAKEMAFLSTALLMAVFLIFLIMVMQFNSAGTPFLIIASVLFSTIGVFLGLIIFQMTFIIIMTMIGIISLAGVVVNNAIVLIDYTNLLRERRKEELGLSENERLPLDEILNCIVEGGKTRLRPVLLTAITTVLGLLPLATGMNINFFTLFSEYDAQMYFGGDNVIFWGPMSWTVIFGLTFATFLTLVIIPVMYLIKERMKYRLIKEKVATGS